MPRIKEQSTCGTSNHSNRCSTSENQEPFWLWWDDFRPVNDILDRIVGWEFAHTAPTPIYDLWKCPDERFFGSRQRDFPKDQSWKAIISFSFMPHSIAASKSGNVCRIDTKKGCRLASTLSVFVPTRCLPLYFAREAPRDL